MSTETAELKKLGEDLNRGFAEFKAAHERELAELKKLGGDATAETKAQVERIAKQLDETEAKMNRLLALGEARRSADAGEPTPERKAFRKALREGVQALAPEERKALTVANDTTGGYLAVPEFVREIIKAQVEFSPVRSVARVTSTSKRAVQVPKRTGTFAAQWVSEAGTRSETTGLTYGREEIPTHEMYALVDISQQDLEDSEFDLESELRMEFAEQFGVAEGAAFISGNGVGKPQGILSNSSVSTTNSGGATTLTPDGIIDMIHAQKEVYARNGRILLRRASLGAIRKFKDSQNQYLWQPSLIPGNPSTIFGVPYVECVDMPAIAASAVALAYGDFQKGYRIVDRIDMQIVRDNVTQATSGMVRFIARKRVGGQVVLAEAIRTQTVSA
jgi:HK97 family phage major capsid protein